MIPDAVAAVFNCGIYANGHMWLVKITSHCVTHAADVWVSGQFQVVEELQEVGKEEARYDGMYRAIKRGGTN